MNVTDEIRRTLSDPKPLYAIAGAGDLAAEKLKDAPERLRDTPTLLAEAGATLTTLANRIAAEAPERLAQVTTTVQGAGKARPDAQALRGMAQTVAIQQVGRLLEAAGKAVETYDDLAERGKVVIARYTGVGTGGEGFDGENVPTDNTVTVLVEQVTDEDEIGEPATLVDEPVDESFETAAESESATEAAEIFEDLPETAAEAAQVFQEAAEAEGAAKTEAAAEPEPKKPEPKKAEPRKPAARKRAASPKTPRAPKN